MKFSMSKVLQGASALAVLTAVAPMAHAQESTSAPATSTDDAATVDEEIVVTGTQIRGVAPTGSQTIALSADDITEAGAFSPNELLGTIPQIGQFNGRVEQDPRGAFQDSINRPNLRNLPGFNAASGSVTLIMVDGHRLTPVGVGEATIDPDMVPAQALERVDVVTDGGSSIYGADAVAGVINFITRRSFDGVQLDANYALGDTISGYSTKDASIIAGTHWQGGNGYVSYAHSSRDPVLNGDTSWARQGVWQSDGTLNENIDTQCRTPQNTVDRFVWIPFGINVWTDNTLAGGGTRSLGTGCNTYAEAAYLAGQVRDNFFGSVTQDLRENLSLHVTGYYSKRDVNMPLYPLGYTNRVTASPPSTPGTTAFEFVDVPAGTAFSFGPNPNYVDHDFTQTYETWGVTPELTWDIGNDWQLRTVLHYGRSENTSRNPLVNPTAAAAAISGGTLDPNNVAAASAAVIQNILDWTDAQDTKHELFDVRSVADGSLFALPAGDVKLAIGVEYADQVAETRLNTGTFASINALPYLHAERNVSSVFAEANVPVISALDLSLAVRYDNYSDFGSTTNPTLGFDLHPVDGIKIYGHWGKSFNAPTPLDSFGVSVSSGRMITGLGASTITGQDALDGDVDWDGTGTDILQGTGSSTDIGPQTAEQWSLGGEFTRIDGVRLGVNYYEIDFSGILGAVNPQLPAAHIGHPEKFIWNPTQAQWDAYRARVSNGASLPATPANIAFILDRITDNLDSAKLTGVDFNASYTRDTDWGTFDIGVSGNLQLTFLLNGTIDNLKANVPDLNMLGTIGWRGGDLSTRLSFNYTDGFKTDTAKLGQTRVDSFLTTDLFVGYDLGHLGFEGSQLRFGIDNLTDETPPVWRQNTSSLAWSGYTLGRVFKFGVTAHF